MKTVLNIYLVTFLAGACLMLSAERSIGDTAPDEAAIASTVEAFHKGLTAGEPNKVMSLLLPDALVIEAGTIQTRDEYQREHLAEDIAFARAVPVKSHKAVVHQEGNAAWVTTMSRVVGEFQKRPIDSTGAETVILTKTPGGWRIRSIHWSSHKAAMK